MESYGFKIYNDGELIYSTGDIDFPYSSLEEALFEGKRYVDEVLSKEDGINTEDLEVVPVRFDM